MEIYDSIFLHVMKGEGRLVPFENSINLLVREAVEKITKKIPLKNVDILIRDYPPRVPNGKSVGGMCELADLINIYIKPLSADLQNNLKKELYSTLAHEAHHCVRIRGVGYGYTLIEAMVSEGLADHFDIEINGSEIPPWSLAIPDSDEEKYMKMAENDLNDKNYDANKWFWGSDPEVPFWAAYSLGFKIVRRYLEKTGKKAGELYNEPYQSFL